MKKLTNKKGFTLMEMIIVIAIIVILAAISIPTLTGNLDAANKAADEANLRAAKSAAMVLIMEDGKGDANAATNPGQDGTYYYDIAAAELKLLAAGATVPATANGECSNHTSDYIEVVIDDDAVESVGWKTNPACN